MTTKSQRSKGRNDVLSLYSTTKALNLVEEASSIAQAKTIIGSVSCLLSKIKHYTAEDYFDFGLYCADLCKALDRGLSGRRSDELSQPVREAIGQLAEIVTSSQSRIVKQSNRNAISRLFYRKIDKIAIAAWMRDLAKILHVFKSELAINDHSLATDVTHNELQAQGACDRCGSVLQADCDEGLGAAIELSLTSPTFLKLGPDARALLEVISFFPQGISETNFKWLFPTVHNLKDTLSEFCLLRLTYHSNGFFTMQAQIRDHFCPRDPGSSPLLCAVRDHYFNRLSANIIPDDPGFKETQWIISEDVNVEHLLDVFTSLDPGSDTVWGACSNFMRHLSWHKKRLTILGPKIESLPDDRYFKHVCLFELAYLYRGDRDYTEAKRLLTHALEISRKRGDDLRVAWVLQSLCQANRKLSLHEEAVQQAKEALGIFERIGEKWEKSQCLTILSHILRGDKQFDAAVEAATSALGLLTEDRKYHICESQYAFGLAYRSKGETDKAVHHFRLALEVANDFNWFYRKFWTNYSLAKLFSEEGRFEEAHARIEEAELVAADDPYHLACSAERRARVLYLQRRLEEAKSETLRALEMFEKLKATRDIDYCKTLLPRIEAKMESQSGSGL